MVNAQTQRCQHEILMRAQRRQINSSWKPGPQRGGFKDDLKEYIEFPYVELHEEGKGFPGGGNEVSKGLEGGRSPGN